MLQIVFDDRSSVPEEVRALVNVDHFGDLVFRRRSWLETIRGLAREAGWPQPICLRADLPMSQGFRIFSVELKIIRFI